MSMKSIRINDIIANAQRNFNLYPIDKKQVMALVESYEAVDDFGSIPVRPSGRHYEQAAGHHRLAAMKELGYTHANCIVSDYNDDQMVSIMVLENARQKGDNAPAALDSLSAITRRVAYYLLLSDCVEDYAEQIGYDGVPTGLTATGFERVKDGINNGDPIGYAFLQAYALGGIGKETQTKELNRALQSSGELGRIYKSVQDRVEGEIAAEEEAERALEEARKKAEAKAQREAEAAERAAEAARKAAVKAKASQKAAAEAAAKEAERIAKRKAKLRAEERARIDYEREEAATRKDEMKKRQQEAAEAAKSAKEAAGGLHPDMLNIIKVSYHLNAFRAAVTSVSAKAVIPMSKHVEIWDALVKDAEIERVEVTAKTISLFIGSILAKADSAMLRMQQERDAMQAKASATNKVRGNIAKFSKSVGDVNVALMKLAEVLDDDELGELAYLEVQLDAKFTQRINGLEEMLVKVRQSLKVRKAWSARNRPVNEVA